MSAFDVTPEQEELAALKALERERRSAGYVRSARDLMRYARANTSSDRVSRQLKGQIASLSKVLRDQEFTQRELSRRAREQTPLGLEVDETP